MNLPLSHFGPITSRKARLQPSWVIYEGGDEGSHDGATPPGRSGFGGISSVSEKKGKRVAKPALRAYRMAGYIVKRFASPVAGLAMKFQLSDFLHIASRKGRLQPSRAMCTPGSDEVVTAPGAPGQFVSSDGHRHQPEQVHDRRAPEGRLTNFPFFL